MDASVHKLSASVLATVLVVCILMLLGLLMIFHLWNTELLYYDLYHRDEQARMYRESGFLLYARDSTLMERLDEDSTVLLFEGEQDSRLYIGRESWGLYEAVRIKNVNGRQESVRLMGKKKESPYNALLYLPENGRSFSLTGKTFLEGDLYLPCNGIAYTQMRSEFFQGRKVEERYRKVSADNFPEREPGVNRRVQQISTAANFIELPANKSLRRSFKAPAVRIEVGEYLAGMDMKGHILLYTSGDLFIEQDNSLENVIVCARKVEIADDFCGSLQIFAEDTILLGNRVCLKSGSGLFVNNPQQNGMVRLGEYSEINGYIVVEGGEDSNNGQKRAVYYQPQTSRVRGLVFIDGIAEVHGYITGSLYARSCYYFAPEGYYSEILYNAFLAHHPEINYPLFMQGPYERKEVKWLD